MTNLKCHSGAEGKGTLGRVGRALLACACLIAFSPASWAQSSAARCESEISAINSQLRAIEAQQKLILSSLNDLKANLPTGGTAAAGTESPEMAGLKGDDKFKGAATAKVVLIEYGDYQCPFCGQFERDTLPQILANYIQTGKIRFSYRDLPLPSHAQAMLAAEAARCAGEQDHYWQMHDALFANQDELSADMIHDLARTLVPNAAAFEKCLTNRESSTLIQSAADQARKASITATPTFVIGKLDSGADSMHVDREIVGAVPYSVLKDELDKLLGNLQAAPLSQAAAAK